MTIAVCLQCGENKIGALTRCAKCSFDPEAKPLDHRVIAQSLMLSDRLQPPENLKRIGAALARGEKDGMG